MYFISFIKQNDKFTRNFSKQGFLLKYLISSSSSKSLSIRAGEECDLGIGEGSAISGPCCESCDFCGEQDVTTIQGAGLKRNT